jgi:hypothetical protein
VIEDDRWNEGRLTAAMSSLRLALELLQAQVEIAPSRLRETDFGFVPLID